MDAWNPDQLKRMQLGGNGKLNSFLSQYGVDKHVEIKEKYNSKAAEFYREKLRADVDGRSYTPPPPSEVPSAIPRPRSYAGNRTSNKDWDDWGSDGPKPPVHAASSAGLMNARSNEYSMAQLQASAASKEDFFARKMAENSSRPEGLPPSQGGKYVGFGSTPAPPPRRTAATPMHPAVDDVTVMFSRGLSGLGTLAGQAASAAKEQAAHVNLALKDSGMTETLGQTANVAAEKTKEYGAKGWSLLKSAYAAAAATIEQTAAQQGYKVDLGSKKVSNSSSGTQYSRIGGSAPEGYSGSAGWDDGHQGGSYGLSAHRSDDDRQGLNGTKDSGFGGFDGDGDEWGGKWESAATNTSSTAVPNKSRGPGGEEWSGWEEAQSPSGGNNGNQEWGKW